MGSTRTSLPSFLIFERSGFYFFKLLKFLPFFSVKNWIFSSAKTLKILGKNLSSLSLLVSFSDQMSASILLGKLNGDESSTVTTEEDEEAVFSGEEWSGENLYCFYFVKQFAYDDPEIKAKIDEADNEIYHCNTNRIHIANRLKSKRAERLSLVASMENLISSLYEYNAVGKDQEVVTKRIYSLSERLSEIKMEIELLDVQMACVLDQRDKAVERIKFLRIQRDKGNAAFYRSRVVMKKAIELAASGNVRDLEELADFEVEKFMSRWNNDKAFREDYKKRILPSLNERKLRRDVQIRDLEGNVDTENGNETVEKKAIEFKRFSTEEESDDVMDFDIPVYEKLGKEEDEIDEETLKEKKREEQLEKARLAMERKRKLHEKAAAKAVIRVKKEAEKKLKELEKRAKKKKKAAFNSSSMNIDRTTETVTEASEPEKEKLLNGRSVFPKQRSFCYRHHGKGNDAVLKAIIKRRKAYRLWVWTVSSSAIVLSLTLLVVFLYVR
ncbi:proton pump-interactor 4 isoform X1 [Arabidopsis lyrata subsp. lyrata]|uniref:proton pump-interactor 4 isoform X1 n=2 Tax=Arabidopsis lyrata subsp. lyrata TaxID=81972 RepID=UPI000A29D631|nr:proton pump-interactor 4 isoform X1 [Arabidopsis lyrata subsp. lyrata]|eukprot:XP_020867151.1 proton pump-interactor 4 isoform X1 [Arabidopsis lyrata subsp. lyrata]